MSTPGASIFWESCPPAINLVRKKAQEAIDYEKRMLAAAQHFLSPEYKAHEIAEIVKWAAEKNYQIGKDEFPPSMESEEDKIRFSDAKENILRSHLFKRLAATGDFSSLTTEYEVELIKASPAFYCFERELDDRVIVLQQSDQESKGGNLLASAVSSGARVAVPAPNSTHREPGDSKSHNPVAGQASTEASASSQDPDEPLGLVCISCKMRL